MAAEEAKEPHRSVPIAYIGGILTLVALALGVMVFAGGSGDSGASAMAAMEV